jgi:hypothetical protein
MVDSAGFDPPTALIICPGCPVQPCAFTGQRGSENTMQIYEQWDSGRPYSHPASLAFWERELDQWVAHIEAHVLPPRLADKAMQDLHLQIEMQRQKKRY